MIELLSQIAPNYKCVAYEGNSIVMFLYGYTPFVDTTIDAYYVSSNLCYHQSVNLSRAINQLGYNSTHRVNAPLKELCVSSGLAQSVGTNSLAYCGEFGSRFCIGAVSIEGIHDILPLASPNAATDMCRGCSICTRACPMGAIEGSGNINTSKCLRNIMYNSGTIDDETAVKLHNRVLGCDICQRCCPHNHIRPIAMPDTLDQLKEQLVFPPSIKQLSSIVGSNMAKTTNITNLAIIRAGNLRQTNLLPTLIELSHEPRYQHNATRAIGQITR